MAAPATFTPDYISPPGETLEDVLEERGMTQAELAERAGLSRKTVNEIIKGKAPITPQTALHLERVFGIAARFWNAREHQYRETLARRAEAEELTRQAEWVSRFPYREMAKMDLVPSVDGRTPDAIPRKGRALLDYFGVASAKQWTRVWLQPGASFRKALTFTSNPEPVSAWLRYGEKVALEKMETTPYDERRFRDALHQIRSFTRERPDVFCGPLVKACSDAGVAVVFTPRLPKARIWGATRWLRSDLALLQLSLHYKTNGHFWFSFFHEAAHLLIHGKREVFLEGSEHQSEHEKEQAADELATHLLIPRTKMKAFLAQGTWSHEAVLRFADELGVAPGIVVGQLHHRAVLPSSDHRGLKRKFEWKQGSLHDILVSPG